MRLAPQRGALDLFDGYISRPSSNKVSRPILHFDSRSRVPKARAFNQLGHSPIFVARHGIEPYPLAFQTSTLLSSSRAKLGGRCETQTGILRLLAVGNPLIRTAHFGRNERN